MTVELPGLSAAARRLGVKWHDQILFDSEGAEETLDELESELAGIEPDIDSLLDREWGIAA